MPDAWSAAVAIVGTLRHHGVVSKRRTLLLLACGTSITACPSARVPADADTLSAGLRAGSHEVTLNGVRHFYRVGGNAPAGTPPVVFLHGGAGEGKARFEPVGGPALEV